jgi:UDP-glucose 4-epimerase
MVAITGTTGFIGSYIVDFLPFPQKRLIRRPTTSTKFLAIQGDLNNHSDLETFVEGTDTLVHLAWINNPWTANRDINHDIGQNLISTVHLFETFAKKNPHGHIIFVSTGGNMYEKNRLEPATELDTPKPWSSYSINKLSAEHYLRFFCTRYGIKGTVMRISNPYGVILPSSRTNGLIGVIFAKLLNNEPLNIIDSLESVRDYLHLDDLKEAFNAIVRNPPSTGDFRIFNVSSGIGYSMQEVMQMIEQITDRKIIKNFINANCSPSWSVLSHQSIKKTLYWEPKITLKEGLMRMWEDNHV